MLAMWHLVYYVVSDQREHTVLVLVIRDERSVERKSGPRLQSIWAVEGLRGDKTSCRLISYTCTPPRFHAYMTNDAGQQIQGNPLSDCSELWGGCSPSVSRQMWQVKGGYIGPCAGQSLLGSYEKPFEIRGTG